MPGLKARKARLDDVSAGELVRRARDEHDESAWTALVGRYAGLLWSVTRAYGLDVADACDVAQTTWLRLVEHLDQIRDGDAVGGWLAVTARRECERHRRREKPALPLLPLQASAPEPDQVVLGRERLTSVADALRHLPARCRDLLRLLACPGVSYADVTEILGIPLGGIGPTRARCLTALRARLNEGNQNPRAKTDPNTRGAGGAG